MHPESGRRVSLSRARGRDGRLGHNSSPDPFTEEIHIYGNRDSHRRLRARTPACRLPLTNTQLGGENSFSLMEGYLTAIT